MGKSHLPTLPRDILISIIRDIILEKSQSGEKIILNRRKLKELIDNEIQKRYKDYKLIHSNTLRDIFDITESMKELPYRYIEKDNQFHEIEIIPSDEISESISTNERLRKIENNLKELLKKGK